MVIAWQAHSLHNANQGAHSYSSLGFLINTSAVPYIPPTLDTALVLGTDGVLCNAVCAGFVTLNFTFYNLHVNHCKFTVKVFRSTIFT